MSRVDFRNVSDAEWIWVSDDEDLPETGAVVLSVKRLMEDQDKLEGRNAPIGVRVEAGEQVEDLTPLLDRIFMVALNFPAFNDGRAFSSARVLREALGYLGEIRAVGEVLVDTLRFMQRCGFSSAELAPRVNPEAAERALARYSVVYQASSDEIAPAHRLRRLQRKEAAA